MIILPLGLICFGQYHQLLLTYNEIGDSIDNQNQKPNNNQTISVSEKAKINQWISANQLNNYGDPAGTYYTGGTPLFDESTGQNIDRYQYILSKHPDRPWQNS